MTLDPSMICAGSATNDTMADACVGDSGGALVCGGYAVGIISHGSEYCGDFEYPTINTNISSFNKWILHNSISDYDTHYDTHYKIIGFIIILVIITFLFVYYFKYSLWSFIRNCLLTPHRDSITTNNNRTYKNPLMVVSTLSDKDLID